MPYCTASGWQIRSHAPCASAICLLLFLLVFSCKMDFNPSNVDGPLSLGELETRCGLPAACGTPITCQGQTVSLRGYVDPANIFSKKRFPQVPYEKFRLVDHQGHAIEIWAEAGDNDAIFEKLAERSSDHVVVTGKLAAFDMPITSGCQKGIKLLIHDASQIAFK